ncbi:MAG TPA: biotin--[acetyl-CoA-carboxylase] ligase, partial [Orrella sp.]
SNTNLLATLRKTSASESSPALLGAHHQTRGKGRLGRHWLDQPGQALMFSCGFTLSVKNASSLASVGPALGINSRMAISEYLIEPAALCVKWPNDLMLGAAKVAGLLTEAATKGDRLFVVIGMGLNLQGNSMLSTALKREVADIAPALQPDVRAQDLVIALARAWQSTLETVQYQGFAPYHGVFTQHDYLAGQPARVLQQGNCVASGTVQGLDQQGRLLVMTETGLAAFDVGDVSVSLTDSSIV